MNATTQSQIVSKMHDYRNHLKTISDGLVEMAKASGREEYSINTLLRECYNLIGKKLHTFDEWKEQNCSIRKGEHAYLFWDKPKETANGKRYCPVMFLFSEDQIKVNASQATA